MASEYYKQKYKDVKPREKKELTRGEKWKNWWYYNKWLVLGTAVVLIAVFNLLATGLGIFKTRPDLQVALISERAYSQAELERIEKAFEEITEDFNKDGKVYVGINTYLQMSATEHADEVSLKYADEVRIVSDLDGCESFLFVTDNPEKFQERFMILSLPDGTVSESVEPYENCVYAMESVKCFESVKDLMASFFIGRRGFWTSKTVKNYDGCLGVWQRIMNDAE